MPPLFYGVDITLWWTTLVAGSFGNRSAYIYFVLVSSEKPTKKSTFWTGMTSGQAMSDVRLVGDSPSPLASQDLHLSASGVDRSHLDLVLRH